jgi:hypothetical protein
MEAQTMCCARAMSLAFAIVMTNTLVRIDEGRAEFVEWMNERGACVDDILRAGDVRPHWRRLLCEMRAWMSRSQGARCQTPLPRAPITLEEIIAQRRLVRLLLPTVDDHASVFCVSLASLLALHAVEPTDLLCAIDAAMIDGDAPANTSQSAPRLLVRV